MPEIERAIQVYAIIQLAVIGASHVVCPRVWVSFFTILRERGEAGVFAVAFLSLAFGSIVVAFHNVWTGIPAVLTVLGWAQVAKGLVYFTFPSYGLRKIHVPTEERAGLFAVGGVVCLVIAALLAYHVARS